jgi:plastocyanin
MFFSLITSAAALLSLVAIPSAQAARLDVVVGGPGVLKFNPEFVTAAVGDKVVFSFRQKNHTATQSSLANPCTKAPGGFDSGFVPVPDSNTGGPYPPAEFTVKDLKPVWVYCAQGSHCSAGMVFAINPGPGQFAQFKSAATGSSAAAPAAAPTSAAGSTDFKVVVGGPGKLLYDPANIKAKVGDTITFEFHQKNHTVTQSTFANPCRALGLTSTTGQVGFDSGFVPVADSETTFPTWTIRVNDTTPIWGYCRQGNHCGQGMVFAVNSVDTGPNSFDAFQAKAKSVNGTSGASPTTAPTSGALSKGIGYWFTLAMVGIVTGLTL